LTKEAYETILTAVVPLLLVRSRRKGQKPPTPETWEPAIKKFEESDRQHPPEKGGVLFIGSSSIRMWESLAEDFPDVKVLNRGFGGSEIADSTYYAGRIIVPYRPRMIVLYAGDNDLASGRSPDRVSDEFKEFVERVRKELPSVKIAFISIKPSPARWSLVKQMQSANEKIRSYIGTQKGLVYIDVFAPMLHDGEVRKELFGADGLHMNPAGYKLWTSVVRPYLK
jgi:lysophospholipase L1-like esterase